jgi:N-acetyl-gamma-glutamylphosphate reductase
MTVITVLPSIVSPGDTLAAGQAAQNLNVMAGPPKHWGLA